MEQLSQTMVNAMMNKCDLWVDALKKRPEIITVLKALDKDYTKTSGTLQEKLTIIFDGINGGYTTEQIKKYANPVFSIQQMYRVKEAIRKKLTEEQIKFIANPDVPDKEMKERIDAFARGLNIDQYKYCRSFDLDYGRRLGLYNWILDGLSYEDIAKYYGDGKSNKFSVGQMEQIRYGLKHNLSEKQIKLYATTEFNDIQMSIIRTGFQEGLTIKQVKMYAKPKFTGNQMYQIKEAIKTIPDMTEEQFNLFANPAINYECMFLIIEGIKKGFSIEKLRIYAKPECTLGEMKAFLRFIQRYYSEDRLNILLTAKFDECQMLEIIAGFEKLSDEQVKLYAKECYLSLEMSNIREALESGIEIDKVTMMLNPEFDFRQIREIKYGFEEGLSKEQVAVYAKPKLCYETMRNIRRQYSDLFTVKWARLAANDKLNVYQSLEVITGCNHGLSIDQVKLYAKPSYTSAQMQQIREGFEAGLTLEQIKLYAKKSLYPAQMQEVKQGLVDGLSIEQVKTYSSAKNASTAMYAIRKGFTEKLKRENLCKAVEEAMAKKG